jgi:hypothetical protein
VIAYFLRSYTVAAADLQRVILLERFDAGRGGRVGEVRDRP